MPSAMPNRNSSCVIIQPFSIKKFCRNILVIGYVMGTSPDEVTPDPTYSGSPMNYSAKNTSTVLYSATPISTPVPNALATSV